MSMNLWLLTNDFNIVIMLWSMCVWNTLISYYDYNAKCIIGIPIYYIILFLFYSMTMTKYYLLSQDPDIITLC